MRWLPQAIPVLIAVIALDFTLVFGIEAVRVLVSPIHGLDRMAFAHLVYGIGRWLTLDAQGLLALAAFFGAVYLTIAVVLVLHLASRIAALRGGVVAHDLLDAGLILIVIVTILAATPAILQGASDILVQERLPLWLVGLAATLSMIERLPDAEPRPPGLAERLWTRLHDRRNPPGHRVAPAIRLGVSGRRWDDLRDDAGMTIAPAPIVRDLRS